MKNLAVFVCVWLARVAAEQAGNGPTAADNGSKTADYGPIANLSASNLTWMRDSELRLNCSLTSATWSSDQLDFVVPVNHANASVVVVDGLTAQLVWTPLQLIKNAEIACVLRDFPATNQNTTLAQTYITVGDAPEKPVITGCINYNEERVVCTWYPSARQQTERTGLETTQTLHYSINGYDLRSCDGQMGKESACDLGQVFPNSPLTVYVKATNEIASVYSNSSTTTPSLIAKNPLGEELSEMTGCSPYPVKLDPVKSLTVVKVTNTSVKINCSSPLYFTLPSTLDYEVTLVSEWYSEENPDMRSMIGMICLGFFDDLHPNTRYNVSVRVRKKSGERYWSDNSSVVVRTKAGVPGKPPSLSPGGFVISERPSYLRNVLLYWQALPVYLRHGTITGFRVVYTEVLTTGRGKEQVKELAGGVDLVGTNLTLRKDLAYEVHVDVRSEMGYNKGRSTEPLVIPTQEDILPVVEELEAVRDGVWVNLTWRASSGSANYRVFWCPSSHSTGQCQKAFLWESVNTTRWRYKLPLDTAYLVGVSTEQMAQSGVVLTSGIHMADCIHDNNQDTVQPKNVHLPEIQLAGEVKLIWTAPACHDTAYITRYIVNYCRVAHCNNVSSVYVRRNETSVTIGNLTEGEEYKLYMVSESRSGVSRNTPTLNYVVKQSGGKGLAGWQLALVVVFVGLAAILLVVGLIATYKNITKKYKDFMSLKVTLPGNSSAHTSVATENVNLQVAGNGYYRVNNTEQSQRENKINYLNLTRNTEPSGGQVPVQL